MEENIQDKDSMQQQLLDIQQNIIAILIRLGVLEKSLIDNNILDRDKYVKEINDTSETILQKIKFAYTNLDRLKASLASSKDTNEN